MLSQLVGKTPLTSPLQRLPESLTLGPWGLGACHSGCSGWDISRPMLCCSTALTGEGGTLLLSMDWAKMSQSAKPLGSSPHLQRGTPFSLLFGTTCRGCSVSTGTGQTETRSSFTPRLTTHQPKHAGGREDNKSNKEWYSPVILFWKELEQVPLPPAQVLPKYLLAYCFCAGTKIVCGPFKSEV